MRKALFIAAILLPIVVAGCGEGNKTPTDEFITVNVNASYPEKELILQDFADVEYIVLETTDEFITKGHVNAVGKNILLVTNRINDGNIFVFDRSGKGLRRINRLGQSGEEYAQITAIILDEKNEEMFVIDYPARKIKVYDLYGNFKRSFPFTDTSYYTETFNYDADHLICYKGYLPSVDNEQSCHVLISKQDGSITREIPIPFKEIISPVVVEGETSVTPFFYLTMPQQENWLLMRPSSDTIYTYLPNGDITPFLVRTPSIHTMEPPVVFLFPGAIIPDRYYFIQTLKKEVDFTTMKGFPTNDLVYDRQENAVFEYTIYNGDFSNKKPVYLGSKPLNQEIVTYQLLSAPDLVEAYGKGQLKGKLKEIAAELDEEDNPVIMLIKHKK